MESVCKLRYMCAVMDGIDADSQSVVLKKRLTCLKVLSITFFIVALCFWVLVSVLESFWVDYIDSLKHIAFSAYYIFTTAMMLTGTVMMNLTMRTHFNNQIQERRVFMCVYLSITMIATLHTIFLIL